MVYTRLPSITYAIVSHFFFMSFVRFVCLLLLFGLSCVRVHVDLDVCVCMCAKLGKSMFLITSHHVNACKRYVHLTQMPFQNRFKYVTRDLIRVNMNASNVSL